MWRAIQRSVGVASSAATKYSPGRYGAAACSSSVRSTPAGSHSTPMIHPASHGDTSVS